MYLELPPGEMGINNILKMAREGLRRDLTMALHKATGTREIVRCPGLRVKTNGHFTRVNLSIHPVAAGSGGLLETPLYLVNLEEAPPLDPVSQEPSSGAAEGLSPESELHITALHQELRAKEEYLQTANEELETSNEELNALFRGQDQQIALDDGQRRGCSQLLDEDAREPGSRRKQDQTFRCVDIHRQQHADAELVHGHQAPVLVRAQIGGLADHPLQSLQHLGIVLARVQHQLGHHHRRSLADAEHGHEVIHHPQDPRFERQILPGDAVIGIPTAVVVLGRVVDELGHRLQARDVGDHAAADLRHLPEEILLLHGEPLFVGCLQLHFHGDG